MLHTCTTKWVTVRHKIKNKVKFVECILITRKLVNNAYALEQDQVIDMLSLIWGGVATSVTIHHNKCIQIFGIVMTIEENCYICKHLSERVTAFSNLDDHLYSIKKMLQNIAFSFNNEKICIELHGDL